MLENKKYNEKKAPKCQNRSGMECIKFRGKNIYFKDQAHLEKLLNISVMTASKLINGPHRRVIKNINENIDILDIRKNQSGLLRQEFGIQRISNEKLISGINTKTILAADKFGENEAVKVQIRIYMYITFPSPEYYDIFHFLTEDGKLELINEILNSGYKMDFYRNFYKSHINQSGLEEKIYMNMSEIYKLVNENIIKKIRWSKVNEYIDNGKIFLRSKLITFEGFLGDSKEEIERIVDEYIGRRNMNNGSILFIDIKVLGMYTNKEFKYEDGFVSMMDNEFELTEWANIEYNQVNNRKDTCAVRFLASRYPEYYWDIKNKETKKGIKITDFIKICKNLNIPYKLYDEIGNLRYGLDILGTDVNQILCGIVYNNHIYPISGGKVKRVPRKQLNIKLVQNGTKKLRNFLDSKILPSKIKISDIISNKEKENIHSINILSFNVKNKKYISNPEYKKCLEILTNMGFEKFIKDNTHISDIPNILEKALRVENTSSFFPEKHLFKTSAFYYKTDNEIDIERVVTEDKNKAYPYALHCLPYLLRFDFRKNKINEMPKKIIGQNLYWVRPKYSTLEIPATGFYEGYHLTQCEELNIEFELLEELECDIVPNYYRKIINLMYKYMTNDDFKTSTVILIGIFEKNTTLNFIYKYAGIYNNDSSKMNEGFTYKLGNHTLFYHDKKQYVGVRDKMPISIQVKNMCRMILSKRIRERKIKDTDIVYINTDNVSYYGKLPKDLDKTKLNGWKSVQVDFESIGQIEKPVDDRKKISFKRVKNMNNNNRILHMQYAGSGKTYYIINILIPNLLTKKIRFIVLTPSHQTLQEYKNAGINCEIIQKFIFSKGIPDEDYIIIDEIGFIDSASHDVLYKINYAGKSFECFGDFNQLPPIGDDRVCNQPHYLEYMFNKIYTSEINSNEVYIYEKFINKRNNFTKEYYDSLINTTIDIHNEVNKWSTKNIEDADMIVCFTHKIRHKYNEKMLDFLGKKKFDIGVKIICMTNKLIDKDIYNHKKFIIYKKYYDKVEDIIKYIIDDNKKKYKITENELLKNFDNGYAVNIHQLQGDTINSFYWCSENNNFMNGNLAYTLISRLRQYVQSIDEEEEGYLLDFS